MRRVEEGREKGIDREGRRVKEDRWRERDRVK